MLACRVSVTAAMHRIFPKAQQEPSPSPNPVEQGDMVHWPVHVESISSTRGVAQKGTLKLVHLHVDVYNMALTALLSLIT